MKTYDYKIIRFRHDPSLGECINIGVMVYDPILKNIKTKFTFNTDRALIISPDLDIETWYLPIIRSLNEGLNIYKEDNSIPKDFEIDDPLEKFFNRIIISQDNSFCASETRKSIFPKDKDFLWFVFYTYIGKLEIKKGVSYDLYKKINKIIDENHEVFKRLS